MLITTPLVTSKQAFIVGNLMRLTSRTVLDAMPNLPESPHPPPQDGRPRDDLFS